MTDEASAKKSDIYFRRGVVVIVGSNGDDRLAIRLDAIEGWSDYGEVDGHAYTRFVLKSRQSCTVSIDWQRVTDALLNHTEFM